MSDGVHAMMGYKSERLRTLRDGNVAAFQKFYRRWFFQSIGRHEAEIGMHKARVQCRDLPLPERIDSINWLLRRGCSPNIAPPTSG